MWWRRTGPFHPNDYLWLYHAELVRQSIQLQNYNICSLHNLLKSLTWDMDDTCLCPNNESGQNTSTSLNFVHICPLVEEEEGGGSQITRPSKHITRPSKHKGVGNLLKRLLLPALPLRGENPEAMFSGDRTQKLF